MKHLQERWGERTIFRVEEGGIDDPGIELILRLKGELRTVEREEIKAFLEKVIKELNDERTDLKGRSRTVKFGSSSQEKVKKGWKKSDAEFLRKYVIGLSKKMTERGRKNLAQVLVDLAKQIQS